jgi:hypothetical protein
VQRAGLSGLSQKQRHESGPGVTGVITRPQHQNRAGLRQKQGPESAPSRPVVPDVAEPSWFGHLDMECKSVVTGVPELITLVLTSRASEKQTQQQPPKQHKRRQ